MRMLTPEVTQQVSRRNFASACLILLLAACAACMMPLRLQAQFSQTITESCTPNPTSALQIPCGSNEQTTPALSNIGQSTHYFTVASRNASSTAGPATPALVQQTTGTWVSGGSYAYTLPATPSPADILVFTGGSIFSSGNVLSTPSSANASWNSLVRNASAGTQTVVTLTSGTSWTAPANVTSVQVECIGGGGGGGFLSASNVGGGGGGGGAYARRNALAVTAGNMYTYALGAGGAGSTAGSGGSTTFTGDAGVQCVAAGGAGGVSNTGGAGGSAGASTGDVAFTGGIGVSGSPANGGGGGGSAGKTSNGNTGSGSTGAIAVAGGGPGGNGAVGSGGAGFAPASIPGGGGGGALSSSGTPVVVTLTSGTSWTAPPGVSSIQIECIGGGGGAAGLPFGPSATAGAGGGGYARRNAMAVTAGMAYTYAIGAGGTGSSGSTGGTGGTTTFTGDAQSCTAGGGNGSFNNTIGTGGSGIAGDVAFTGGSGASGTSPSIGGGSGSSAGSAANGNNAVGNTGGAAPSGGGAGVNGGANPGPPTNCANGNSAAANSGGGGSGAICASGLGSGASGGSGGSGIIRITYVAGGTSFSGGNGAAGQITLTYTPTTSESAAWCANLSGTPGAVVTVTLTNGTPTSADGNVSEWSGATCAQDTNSILTGTSATPATTNLATINASDLLIATAHRVIAGTLSSGPTGSYTALNTSAADNAQAYRVVAATGTYGTSWTYSSSSAWNAVSVALQSTAGNVCGGQFAAQLVGSYNSPGTSLPGVVLPTQEIAVEPNGFGGNNLLRTYQATGAYPALNITLPVYDPVNCIYDVYYSGIIGGSVGLGITNDANWNQKSFSVSASGDTTLLTAASQYYLSVYQLQVCSNAASQTVTFQSATTGTGGLIKYATYPSMAAGQCITVPASQLPVWSALAARAPGTQTSTLVMNLANATAVDVTVWYQFE